MAREWISRRRRIQATYSAPPDACPECNDLLVAIEVDMQYSEDGIVHFETGIDDGFGEIKVCPNCRRMFFVA